MNAKVIPCVDDPPETAGFLPVPEYQVQVSYEKEDRAWDDFLAATPTGHHVQTSLWAGAKAVLGSRSARIVIYSKDCIVAGAQVLLYRLPILGQVGFVHRGPVISLPDPKLTGLVFDELHKLSKSLHLGTLVVQPPYSAEAMANRLSQFGFYACPIDLAVTATVLIDLSDDLAILESRIRRTARQDIRRGLRMGLSVREGEEEDLDVFWRLHLVTCKRHGIFAEPRIFIQKLWLELDRYGCIKIFLAELNAEVIAALLVIPFGDTVCFKRVGWSGRHKNCSPNKVLFWEAAKWAKEHGYRCCDYDGIDPDSAKALLQGKSLPVSSDVFKTALGGRVIHVPGTYACVYNPVSRWIYRSMVLKFLQWLPAQRMISKTWFWLKSFNRKQE